MKRRNTKIKRMAACLFALVIAFSMLPMQWVNAQSMSGNFNKSYSLNGDGAHDIVAVAKAQAGRTKAQMGYTEAWCADFVSDSAKLAGVGNVIPFNANCGSLRNAILNAGGKSVSTPQSGDIVFYYCKSCNRYVHVALMTGANSSIQGNYDGRVADNVRPTAYNHGSGHSVSTGLVSVSYVRPAYKVSAPTPTPTKNPFLYSVDSAPADSITYYSLQDTLSGTGWVLTTYGKGQVTCVNLCVNGKDTLNCSRSKRDDVANAYPDYNNKDAGFAFSVRADVLNPGKNTISLRAYATNINPNDILIGDFWEATVYYQPDYNLDGCIDSVRGGKGTFNASGWALNWNSDEAANVHIYKDGTCTTGTLICGIRADKERDDVKNAFGLGSNRHGFEATIPVDCVGEHTFYFYAVSQSGVGNKLLGSRTVTIQENKAPVGILDSLVGGTDSMEAKGWSHDPDSEDPVYVHVYEDGQAGAGRFVGSFTANKRRDDVAKSEHVSSFHGFEEVIKLDSSGKHTYYFYSIDTDGGNNSFIGSKTVDIKQGSSPFGIIDFLKGLKGGIRLGGWTVDKDAISNSVALHIYIGTEAHPGARGYIIYANKKREDVGKEVGLGDYHGFDEIITTTERGWQEVYIYAIDEASNQPNVLLGHGTVFIEEPDVQEEHIHKYTEEITKLATCNGLGEKQFICSCGDAFMETIDKIPHTPIVDQAREATCTVDGISEGSHCSVCGTVIVPQEIVEKTGHRNTVVKYQKDASCVCAGYSGDTYCSDCGLCTEEGKIIKQLEHTVGEGFSLKSATDTEAGIQIFVCTVCETMSVKVIPAIGSETLKESEDHGHEYVVEVISQATYYSSGQQINVCACGEYFEETIPSVVFQENAPTEEEDAEEVTDIPSDTEEKEGAPTDVPSEPAEETGTPTELPSTKVDEQLQVDDVSTQKIVITYKLGGGTNNDTNPHYYEGRKVALKNPVRKGYAFDGWYTDSKFKQRVTAIAGGCKKDITLYARWNKVTVRKASIKKVTGSSEKKAKIDISKVSGAKGYMIQYSMDKKFRKGVQTVNVKKTSVTLTQLKAGKMYVRVRAYKTDSMGNRVYGSYSKVKEVKIRK